MDFKIAAYFVIYFINKSFDLDLSFLKKQRRSRIQTIDAALQDTGVPTKDKTSKTTVRN